MKKLVSLLLSIAIIVSFAGISYSAIEWDLEKSLKVEKTPLGVAVSPDGKYTYVLTEGGTVLVYSTEGKIVDTITTEKSITDIEISKDGSQLFLTNQAQESIDVINISFIHDINIAGSPQKGPAFAPVAIVVFSDFQ